MRTALLICAFLVTGTTIACAGRTRTLAAAVEESERYSGTDSTGVDSAAITVKIENRGFADLTVYMIAEGGSRIRVGMANGHADTVLELPRSWTVPNSRVKFLVHPIGGGRDQLSDEIYITPGDEVVLTVTP